MDRDNNWDRTKRAYDAIVYGIGKRFTQPIDAITSSYVSDISDEFVIPSVIDEYDGIKEGDLVFFFNFRPDRARQLTKALSMNAKEFRGLFDRSENKRPKKVAIITMTVYDPTFKTVAALLEREHVSNTLGAVLDRNLVRQLRIAETEKYAHVTYFFNGLSEEPGKLEERILVPSTKEVGTYDKKPEMSACEITENAINEIESRKYGFILINFANADMVGHSGNIEATVCGVESVDSSLGRIYDAWLKMREKDRPVIIVTSDHGNAEKMFDMKTDQPHTAHTSNPVPLFMISDRWQVSLPDAYRPGLIDVAPSILRIFGLAVPASMTGKPIVMKKYRRIFPCRVKEF